jgi:DNA-binding FadR family transcriptional regulator
VAQPPGARRALRPLHVPKVAELVADDIRRDIALGRYDDGAELPQGTELMARYQISRPTLREALRVLASERLLEMAPGTTAVRVRLPSAEVAARYAGLLLQLRGTTLRDLEDSRLVIEAPAAAMLAERAGADPEILDELEGAIAAEADALTHDDQVEVGRAGLHVHNAVVKLSGNTTLHAVFSLLGSVIERHTDERIAEARDAGPAAGAEDLRRAHRAHRRFLELVRAGDIERASTQWRRHLESISSALLAGGGSSRVVDLF